MSRRNIVGIERPQHPSMTIDVDSGLTNARHGARINTGQSGTMMQLGKGPSNSVAVTLHSDGYITCMAPRPPGS